MKVITWIVEGTWQACVDATREHVADDAEIVLLHVNDLDPAEIARGAVMGLMGRDRQRRDDRRRRDPVAGSAAAARRLLDSAAERLGRPSSTLELSGRVERQVVMAAVDADLLVVARDGDRGRPGPRSIGHATRFVVDHAPCAVLLVWPESAPAVTDVPPPPPPHPPPDH